MDIKELTIEDYELDEDKIHYYESLLSTNIIKNNIKQVRIEQVKASRWVGNIYGLFIVELGLSPNALYLNMRINNISSSDDYNGFGIIEDTYNSNKALKKSLNS